VPSDPQGAGVCAFASCDIECREVVVEYEGEVIGKEEARAREAQYEATGKSCTLMAINSAG